MTVEMLAKDRDVLVRLIKDRERELNRAIENCERTGLKDWADGHRKRLEVLAAVLGKLQSAKR